MIFREAANPKATPSASFTDPLFDQIARRWVCWQRGIPPTCEWLGYDGQNPYLLAAFEALDSAQARVQRELAERPPYYTPRPSVRATHERVKAEVLGGAIN